jgi:hypothetical protein
LLLWEEDVFHFRISFCILFWNFFSRFSKENEKKINKRGGGVFQNSSPYIHVFKYILFWNFCSISLYLDFMNSPHPGRWECVHHFHTYFFQKIKNIQSFFLTSSVDSPLEYLYIYYYETSSLDIKKIKNMCRRWEGVDHFCNTYFFYIYNIHVYICIHMYIYIYIYMYIHIFSREVSLLQPNHPKP